MISPAWWKWATWLSPFYYALSATLQNQFEGLIFNCGNSTQCPYPTGQDLLDFYGVDLADSGIFWLYVSVVGLVMIGNYILLYLVLRYLKWEKR